LGVDDGAGVRFQQRRRRRQVGCGLFDGGCGWAGDRSDVGLGGDDARVKACQYIGGDDGDRSGVGSWPATGGPATVGCGDDGDTCEG
jgi:hypothetical protein